MLRPKMLRVRVNEGRSSSPSKRNTYIRSSYVRTQQLVGFAASVAPNASFLGGLVSQQWCEGETEEEETGSVANLGLDLLKIANYDLA